MFICETVGMSPCLGFYEMYRRVSPKKGQLPSDREHQGAITQFVTGGVEVLLTGVVFIYWILFSLRFRSTTM